MSEESIRDEAAKWISGLISGNGFGDDYVDSETLNWADSLLASPVIRSIQAEAWDEGFDAHDQDWKHHDANNWGDEDCIDATYNPYRDEEPNV